MIEFIEKLPEALLKTLTEQNPAEEVAVKFVLAGVKISLSSGELQYEGSEDHETFGRIADEVLNQDGIIYLTDEYT